MRNRNFQCLSGVTRGPWPAARSRLRWIRICEIAALEAEAEAEGVASLDLLLQR